MKTIKELHAPQKLRAFVSFDNGYLHALKDMLGLIKKECKCCPTVRKLKKRISG